MKCTQSIIVLLSISLWIKPLSGTAQDLTPADSIKTQLIEAAREIMQTSGFCALVTLDSSGQPRARSMSPFPSDSNMIVWFGTNVLSRKVKQIRHDARVSLYYPDPDQSGYVLIQGKAELVDDAAEKVKHWKPEWAAFYPNYPDGYILIKVVPEWLEIISYSRGIFSDSESWIAPRVLFEHNP